MTSKIPPKALKIANIVRQEADAIKVNRDKKMFAYPQPIHSTLAGYCGEVSYVLWRTLLKQGIESVFVSGWYLVRTKEDAVRIPHKWVVGTDNEYAIDLTATQFGSRVKVANAKGHKYHLKEATDSKDEALDMCYDLSFWFIRELTKRVNARLTPKPKSRKVSK